VAGVGEIVLRYVAPLYKHVATAKVMVVVTVVDIGGWWRQANGLISSSLKNALG